MKSPLAVAVLRELDGTRTALMQSTATPSQIIHGLLATRAARAIEGVRRIPSPANSLSEDAPSEALGAQVELPSGPGRSLGILTDQILLLEVDTDLNQLLNGPPGLPSDSGSPSSSPKG